MYLHKPKKVDQLSTELITLEATVEESADFSQNILRYLHSYGVCTISVVDGNAQSQRINLLISANLSSLFSSHILFWLVAVALFR